MPYLLASGTIQKPENVEWFVDEHASSRLSIDNVLRVYCLTTVTRVNNNTTEFFNYFDSQQKHDDCISELDQLPAVQEFKNYNTINNIVVIKNPLQWVDSLPE